MRVVGMLFALIVPAWQMFATPIGGCPGAGAGVPPPQATSAGPQSLVIGGVPAYSWYNGCGPTAAASIIGYWDLHGYPNLFDSAGTAVYDTVNVQDQISSPAHNARYNPTPDNPNLPDPPQTSIADFFRTSVDPLEHGWSYQTYANAAFTGYAAYRGYNFSASYEYFYGGFTWDDLLSSINAGRPMMFLIDTGGDGATDHFVPVIGYDDRGAGGLWYGMYTTWSEDETILWQPFRGIQSGTEWGIAYATFVTPLDAPESDPSVPEPASAVLTLTAVIAGVAFRRLSGRRENEMSPRMNSGMPARSEAWPRE